MGATKSSVYIRSMSIFAWKDSPQSRVVGGADSRNIYNHQHSHVSHPDSLLQIRGDAVLLRIEPDLEMY